MRMVNASSSIGAMTTGEGGATAVCTGGESCIDASSSSSADHRSSLSLLVDGTTMRLFFFGDLLGDFFETVACTTGFNYLSFD